MKSERLLLRNARSLTCDASSFKMAETLLIVAFNRYSIPMLIKREDIGVARIFMVISTANPNICGIDGQMRLE